MQTSGNNSEKLRREIGFYGLGAIAINGLIGAGIFALPSAAAEKAGFFSPFMFIICGILMTTVVLSLGQAASYFRSTGGPILYVTSAFGPLAGFQTGWLLYLGRVTAMAANTNALVNYATLFWSGLSGGMGRFIAISIICLFFTLVNTIGIRQGMRTTNLLTFLKLIPIFLFIGLGLSYVKPSLLINAAPPNFESFGATLLLLVYAFVGFEGALIPAGESKNPKRDLPRALIVTIGITTLLYVCIQSVCMAVLPNVAETKTPLADVAKVMLGNPGAWIMTLAAVFSIAGNLSVIMLAAPRMTYAMARDNALPNWFGNVSDKHKTPAASIIFLGSLSFILAVTGSFVWLAIMSSLARLIGFGISIASLPKLKAKYGNSPDAFKLPGGYLIPLLGLLLCIWLALQAQWDAWLMTACFVLLGTILYYFSRWRIEN